MKQGNSATSSAQNRGSVIRYTLAILSSTFAAFIGGQLVAPIIIAIVASAFFGINESKISDLISNNTYVRFVTILSVEIVTTWFVYRLLKYRHKKFAYIGMSTKPTLKDLGRGLKAYAGYFIVYIAVLTVVANLKVINTTQQQQLGFGHPHGMELLVTFVALVILPPIAEEILFRGYLFFGLKERMRPLYAGIITSLLFGAAHLEFGNGPLNWAAAIDTTTLSCVLVYTANKYKSIWPGMATHAIKNLVAFTLLFVIKR